MKVAGYVLAGGRSSRMGRDKALLKINGEPLVARGLRTLAEVCDHVAIAGGAPELQRFGRVIPDDIKDQGPLGGIVAALEQTQFDWNLFLAVDVPFVPLQAWDRLLALAGDSGAVCIMPSVAGQKQPLCAAYHRSAAAVLRRELDSGHLKVTQAIAAAGRVDEVAFDESPQWFRNFNTPSEFESIALPDQG